MKKPNLKGFKFKMPSLSPFVRMSLGLVCLTLCMVLVGDMVLGLTSDERRALLDQRKKICETLAVQFSELAEVNDIATTISSAVEEQGVFRMLTEQGKRRRSGGSFALDTASRTMLRRSGRS